MSRSRRSGAVREQQRYILDRVEFFPSREINGNIALFVFFYLYSHLCIWYYLVFVLGSCHPVMVEDHGNSYGVWSSGVSCCLYKDTYVIYLS